VIAEIALALVLLVGAGLMLKSFERLRAFNPGFKTDHLLTVRANLSTRKYKPDTAAAFSERLVERIGNLPSVEAVGIGSDLPLDGNSSATIGAIEGSAPGTATTLRTEMQSLDPDLPIYEIATMEQRLKDETAQSRFTTLLLGIFAFVAITLAGVGIYGVMSYAVTQRTHEIGIRMALGAKQGDILRLVVGEGMMLVGAGIVIGLTGAMMATRVLAAQLYSVSATDPATFVIVPLILAGVALAACFVPARRATKVDPMVALRYE
jgi:cell division protein FtsX